MQGVRVYQELFVSHWIFMMNFGCLAIKSRYGVKVNGLQEYYVSEKRMFGKFAKFAFKVKIFQPFFLKTATLEKNVNFKLHAPNSSFF